MGFDSKSKCPQWFQNQKKRIIIFTMIIVSFLSTVQTINLVKKIALSTTIANLYQQYADYFYNGYGFGNHFFNPYGQYGQHGFNGYDDFDDIFDDFDDIFDDYYGPNDFDDIFDGYMSNLPNA